jgi:hypothetical protein
MRVFFNTLTLICVHWIHYYVRTWKKEELFIREIPYWGIGKKVSYSSQLIGMSNMVARFVICGSIWLIFWLVFSFLGCYD